MPTEKTTDAIALLKEDHKLVRELLSKIEDTTARGLKKRKTLLKQIAQEIRVHAQVEEEIFYPAYHGAASKNEDEKLFFEATEEHALVTTVLEALEDTDPSSDVFGAKAKVLKDLVEHHAEEEEDEMFPRARKLLAKARLVELGRDIERRKQQLLSGRRETQRISA